MALSENVITVRVSHLDKAAFKEIANRLQMSQSETLRLLVRETLAVIQERDEKNKSQAARARSGRGG
jgi:hypothetical protein